MRQIVYISTARRPLSDADLAAILNVSRRNNARDRVTGLLLHDGRRFLQALEGDGRQLDDAIARIRQDDRHHAVVILKDRTVDAPEFGPWAMAEERVSPGRGGESLGERVDGLVAGVTDPNVRAMLSGFSRRDRASA